MNSPEKPIGKSIPFNRSSLQGGELGYMSESMKTGQIAGDQSFTRKCQTLLENILGVPRALLTTSCTHALEMAALLADIQPGDEVILPSFTFVSTANAFVLRGARPVFVDVRPDTLNLDETAIGRAITAKTKLIVPVHYAGVACEMEAINEIARNAGIGVVEDNAHGLFGRHKGKFLGTFGCLATQSFHETKNVTCGEGGALLINDPVLMERAEIIREKGTNRSRYFRGQVDKYSWVDLGSSYIMSDLLAAFLFGQLEQAVAIQAKRKQLWDDYHSGLADWCADRGVRQPVVPANCEQAYHMYYLLLPSLDLRQKFIEHLKQRGIQAVFHYVPLHLSPMGRKFGYEAGACPATEDTSDRLVRLPFFNSMTALEQAVVIDAVRQFRV